MHNEVLILQAIEYLKAVDPASTDTVEVQTSVYDDDSKMLTINVAFLAPESAQEDDTTERK